MCLAETTEATAGMDMTDKNAAFLGGAESMWLLGGCQSDE